MTTTNKGPAHYDPRAPRSERFVAANLPTQGWCVIDQWRCTSLVRCGSDQNLAEEHARTENAGTDDPRTDHRITPRPTGGHSEKLL